MIRIATSRVRRTVPWRGWRGPGIAVASVGLLVGAACSSSTSTTSSSSPPTTGGSSAVTGTAPGTAVVAALPSGPSAGCRSASVATPGDEEIHLADRAGTDRYYLRHVPTGYTGSTPMPLVIDIHGYAEGAPFHAALSALGPLGDERGFVTITPHGQGTPVHWDAQPGSVDVELIETIIDQAQSQLCIDAGRVYVTGFSNGAFMSSVIACELSDRVAAVAPVAGIRDVPGCAPARPVPVVTFHGTADHFIEYKGGLGEGAKALPLPDGSGRSLGDVGATSPEGADFVPGTLQQATPDVVAAWAKRNGCEPAPKESPVADDVMMVAFSCPAGREVVLYRIADGGHSWPGSAGSAAIDNVTGRTTMSIDATKLMWDFFASHPMQA